MHYDNPLNVVGTVPVWGDSGQYVLLCKRNIEPRFGKWTLPAGFMELNETTAEGAARETVEEAGAQFEMGEIFTLMNVSRVGQVHIYYRARLLSDIFDPGHETIEARLFTEDQIPWDEIAFRTVKETVGEQRALETDVPIAKLGEAHAKGGRACLVQADAKHLVHRRLLQKTLRPTASRIPR